MNLPDPDTVYFDERKKSRNLKDLNAEELFATESKQTLLFTEKSQKYKDILIDESNLYKPDNETSKSPSCMRMLLAHKKIHNQWPISALLPRGCYLFEGLKTDQKWNPTWKQPILDKPLDPNHFDHISMNLVAYNTRKYNEVMLPFIQAQTHQKDLYLNSDLTPFMVQTIEIPRTAYEEMKAGLARKAEYVTIECPADIEDPVEVPIGITISDGSSTTLTFRLPWLKEKIKSEDEFKPAVQKFTFVFAEISDQYKTHLNGLGTLYAENAHHQIGILSKFLEDFYQLKLKFKVLDLGALAVAAGCRMDCLNLFSLSIVCTYHIFPPDLDNMDQRWGWNTEDQPKMISDYMEIKFKTLVSIYHVLTGMLIRNLFPDPDIVLYALRMTQATFMPWFCSFIAEALSDTRIHAGPDHKPNHYEMKSRAEMVQSIKNGSNFLLDQLTDLYINIPVVSCGGARYLHSTIYSFFNQFSVIEKINLTDYLGEQPRPRQDLLEKKFPIMFNREFAVDDSGAPTDHVGLLANPQFANSIYKLDIASVSVDDLKDLKPQNNRSLPSALKEWSRLNVDRMQSFFFKLNKLSSADLVEFWAERVSVYDYARGLTARVTCRNLRVRSLDLLLANREHHIIDQMEKSVLRNSENLTEARRLNLLKDKISTEVDDRNGLQGAVYKEIPGRNTEKNRQKNDYRKRKCKQFYKDHPGAANPREYKKSKRLRVLDSVDAVLVPLVTNRREVGSDATTNSKERRVNFQSGEYSGRDSRGHSGGDSRSHSRRNSRDHSGRDSRRDSGDSRRDSRDRSRGDSGVSRRDSRDRSRRDSRDRSRRDSRDRSRRDSRDCSRRVSGDGSRRDSRDRSRGDSRGRSGRNSGRDSRDCSSRDSRGQSRDSRGYSSKSYSARSPRKFSGNDLRNKLPRN